MPTRAARHGAGSAARAGRTAGSPAPRPRRPRRLPASPPRPLPWSPRRRRRWWGRPPRPPWDREPRPSSVRPRVLRVLLAVPLIVVDTLVFSLAALVAGPLDRSGRVCSAIARSWARVLLFGLGVRVDVERSEERRVGKECR